MTTAEAPALSDMATTLIAQVKEALYHDGHRDFSPAFWNAFSAETRRALEHRFDVRYYPRLSKNGEEPYYRLTTHC